MIGFIIFFIFNSSPSLADIPALGCPSLFETSPGQAQSWMAQTPKKSLAASTSQDAPKIETETRSELQLPPQSKLQALVPFREKQNGHKPNSLSAGFAKFHTSVAGDSIIVTNKGVWIEVVDASNQKAVESSSHKMDSSCAPFHKAVKFPTAAQKDYFVQFTGSESPNIHVLITSAKKPSP